MFETSLIASAEGFAPRRRGATLAAVAVQFLAVAVVLLLPLLHPELLPRSLSPLTLATPRLQPLTPPPLPRPRVVTTATPVSTTLSAPAPTEAVAASSTAAAILHSSHEPLGDQPPTSGAVDLTGGGSGPVVSGILGPGGGSGPRIAVASAGPIAPTHLLHISGGVSAGMLLAPIQPAYPTIAKVSHIEGAVVIEAIISRTGTVERAHVLSGPAMLQGAALDAVTRARYKPYLLNGTPTEVATTFTINFTMH